MRLTSAKVSKPGLRLRSLGFLPAAHPVQGPSPGGRWGCAWPPRWQPWRQSRLGVSPGDGEKVLLEAR